jgi:cyanophycinase-like exopeptidase
LVCVKKRQAYMSNETEKVEIFIKEDLEASRRSDLVARLEQENGIVSAWFEGGDHHRLTIHYEHDHFSHLTLLDTIKEHGFHGKIANEST